jgi:hypothetical protein
VIALLFDYTAEWAHGGAVDISLQPRHACRGAGCTAWAQGIRSHAIELRGLAALSLSVASVACSEADGSTLLSSRSPPATAEMVPLPGRWALQATIRARVTLKHRGASPVPAPNTEA